MSEKGVESTIVLFGGARIPPPEEAEAARTKTLGGLSKYFTEAQKFARLCTAESLKSGGTEDVIITGRGPGVMEAGCRGAGEVGG